MSSRIIKTYYLAMFRDLQSQHRYSFYFIGKSLLELYIKGYTTKLKIKIKFI